jgi:WhiB family transcriptional regulator, redox-sensing transcriptional regulator
MANSIEGGRNGVAPGGFFEVKFVDLRTPTEEGGQSSPRDRSFMSEGRCQEVDVEVMFPSNPAETAAAKAICRGCPVMEPCLEYALANKIDHGYVGGASERERRRILRRRKQG